MKSSSHKGLGLLVVSTLAAIWAAGCSDDDDKLPSEWFAGGTENGGAKATGGNMNGGVANGGTMAVGGAVNTNAGGTTATSPVSGVAGNAPTAGVGNTNGGSANTGVGGAGGSVSTVGGSTSSSNGGGGGTTSTTKTGAAGSGVVCGTTPSSFAYSNTTFAAGTTLPVNGFSKRSTSGDAQIVTTPAICSGGCLHLSKTYSGGHGAYQDAVHFGRDMTGDMTNLYGATVVVKLAFDNPSNLPMQFSFFAQGPNNSSWGAHDMNTSNTLPSYAVSNGLKEFVWQVADMKDYNQRQFCAGSVAAFGVTVQPTDTIPTSITTATVNVYIQSIEIRPAGYVPTGTGGSSGVAGAAGASSVNMAGNAGTNG